MAKKATAATEETEQKDLTLHDKLVAIAKEVPYIQKKGTNEAMDYKYVGDAQVVETLRDKLLERGILVVPQHSVHSVYPLERGSKPHMVVTTIESVFQFTDGEDSLFITTVGQGTDTGDKGIFKAMTGARKYALLQALLIATGDDPEETRADERDAVSAGVLEQPATAAQKQKLHAEGKTVGLQDESLRKFVFEATGKNRSDQLTKGDMNKLFEALALLKATGGQVVE